MVKIEIQSENSDEEHSIDKLMLKRAATSISIGGKLSGS